MEEQAGRASDGGPNFRTSTKNRWLFSYLFAGLVIFIFGGVTWGYQRLLQSRRCRSQHILATRAFSPNRGGPPRRQISMHCWNPSGSRLAKPEANSHTPTLSSFSIRICASRNGSMELITRVTMSILRSRSPQEKATGSVSIHS